MKPNIKDKIKRLIHGFSILWFFAITIIGILALITLPYKIEKSSKPNTICIDGYTYSILIKDDKPVRCE